jgi:hypothetical protein
MAEKNNKPKKKSLVKRIGIKLFKKVVLFTSKKQVKDLKTHKAEEFKMYAEMLKEILRPQPIQYQDTPMAEYIGIKDEHIYFYDFLKEWDNHGSFTANGMIAVGVADNFGMNPENANLQQDTNTPIIGISDQIEKTEPKLQLKPIEVFHELERIPSPMTLQNLEEKIAMFKMKQKMIKQNHYCEKEVIDFQLRLENRRKYNDYEDFFGKFECTTSEKINNLISKYNLVLATSDLFIATFPEDATNIMNEYQEKTLALCGKKPIFYVIGEKKDFKKKYERNDPILLAQSPFGIYWDILGAWDKEMLLLEEL